MKPEKLNETDVKLNELKVSLTVTACLGITFFIISIIAAFTGNYLHSVILTGVGFILSIVAFLSILPKINKLQLEQFKESIAPFKDSFLKGR